MDAGLYCRIVLDFSRLNAVSLWFLFFFFSCSSGRVFYEVYLFTLEPQISDRSFSVKEEFPLQRYSKLFLNDDFFGRLTR